MTTPFALADSFGPKHVRKNLHAQDQIHPPEQTAWSLDVSIENYALKRTEEVIFWV